MACCMHVWLSIRAFDRSFFESYGDTENVGTDAETLVNEDHVPTFGWRIPGRIETLGPTQMGVDADGECSARISESQIRP